jgi:hypothetical protein
MPRPADDDKTDLWVTAQEGENVVVLTGGALYSAKVPKKDLPDLDVALEGGEAAEELLPPKCFKARLTRLTRLQFRESEMVPTATVTVFTDDDGRERKKILTFADVAQRDQFVKRLNRRLDWPATEEDVSRVGIALKYLGILALTGFATGFLVVAELSGWIERGPALLILCLEWCGVWGVLALGGLLFLLFLGVGIREVIRPPVLVTYEPDE